VIFGLAMFATLFLGAVLAVFLTLGVVRGDAESGLLQLIVVRRSAARRCWSPLRRRRAALRRLRPDRLLRRLRDHGGDRRLVA